MNLLLKIEQLMEKVLVSVFRIKNRKIIDTLVKITRFIFTGGSTFVVHFAMLYAFTEYLHIYYLTSVVIAFILSSFLSFFMHKFWTFKNPEKSHFRGQLSLHFSVAGINLALNTFLVFAFVEWAEIWYMFAQALASIIIAFESYFLLGWVFRHRTEQDVSEI